MVEIPVPEIRPVVTPKPPSGEGLRPIGDVLRPVLARCGVAEPARAGAPG